MKNKMMLFAWALLSGLTLFAQKKIVVMGSSTTLGAAATSTDSSWVGRLQAYYRKNTSPGDLDTVIYVLGGYGYTTWKELPTGYVATIQREAPDPDNNVTKALSFNPDIVILNLPSADVAGYSWGFVSPTYSIHETVDNYRVIANTVISAGAKFFITTPQPRNDLPPAQRLMQRDLRDSTYALFGAYAINFWDDLVTTDGTLGLRDEVRHMGFGDSAYHLNNYGHLLIYNRVVAKNIFATILGSALPVHLTGFTAEWQNETVRLKWNTEQEEPHTSFSVLRSNDGRSFQELATIQAQGTGQPSFYTYTDANPLRDKSYYRLMIRQPSTGVYSNVIAIMNRAKKLVIQELYLKGNSLHFTLHNEQNARIECSLISLSGAVLRNESVQLSNGTAAMNWDVSALPPGGYIFQVTDASGSRDVQRFTRLK